MDTKHICIPVALPQTPLDLYDTGAGALEELRRAHDLESVAAARELHAGEWVDAHGYDLVVAPKVGTG